MDTVPTAKFTYSNEEERLSLMLDR